MSPLRSTYILPSTKAQQRHADVLSAAFAIPFRTPPWPHLSPAHSSSCCWSNARTTGCAALAAAGNQHGKDSQEGIKEEAAGGGENSAESADLAGAAPARTATTPSSPRAADLVMVSVVYGSYHELPKIGVRAHIAAVHPACASDHQIASSSSGLLHLIALDNGLSGLCLVHRSDNC